jgi:AcrR family transcriptional regulator
MTSPRTGLRERKKAKTRALIREQAMRLFEEQGYASTTVDQIADAAEVSPSTFFRYFPTKEDVVLIDDVDAVLLERVRAQPADVPAVEAIRRGMLGVFTGMSPETWEFERRRQRLLLGVPELRMRMLQQMTEAIDLVAGVIAERAGLPAGDFSARVTAGAAVGAMLAVLPSGDLSGVDGVTPDDFRQLDRALSLLAGGLPLGPVPPGAA